MKIVEIVPRHRAHFVRRTPDRSARLIPIGRANCASQRPRKCGAPGMPCELRNPCDAESPSDISRAASSRLAPRIGWRH